METENNKNINNESELQDYLQSKSNTAESWQDVSNFNDQSVGFWQKKKKKLLILLVVVLVVCVGVYVSFKMGHKSFSDEYVSVQVTAPQTVTSGEEINVLFEYYNNNPVSLYDVNMEIFFPNNFVFSSSDQELKGENGYYTFSIPEIKPKTSVRLRVFGRLIGYLQTEGVFSSNLFYKSENFNAKFKSQGSGTVIINFIPVSLNINSLDEIKNNSQLELSLVYKNNSLRKFPKAKLHIAIPDGFRDYHSDSVYTVDTEKSDTIIFAADNIEIGEQRMIKLNGVANSANDVLSFNAKLFFLEENEEFFPYINITKNITLQAPEISITQWVNNSGVYVADKNEMLDYEITFKNQSNNVFNLGSVSSILEGPFDLNTITFLGDHRGVVKNNEIIWGELDVLKNFKPGDEGVVSFRVKVKDIFDIHGSNDKNFVLSVKTNINDKDNLSVPIASSVVENPIKAWVHINTKGYFNDDGRIKNTGSIPPRVGQDTEYTIHWNVKNLFNDVKNLQISTVVPPQVELTGKTIDFNGTVSDSFLKIFSSRKITTQDDINKTQDNIEDLTNEQVEGADFFDNPREDGLYYFQDTRELLWFFSNMKANDGILSPAKEIVFQIRLRPSEYNVGEVMEIMPEVSVSAWDEFTGQTILSRSRSLNTYLEEDFSISLDEARVVK